MQNSNIKGLEEDENKTARRTFSISKEFKPKILDEIDSMHNMSRFVCEAIYEKLERTKNPGKEVADALVSFAQLQSILSEPMQALQSFNKGAESTVSPPPSSLPLEEKQIATPVAYEPVSTSESVPSIEETVNTPLSQTDIHETESDSDKEPSLQRETELANKIEDVQPEPVPEIRPSSPISQEETISAEEKARLKREALARYRK